MARDRAALAKALRNGPAAGLADARDLKWDILRDASGMPVAAAAKRPAAMGDDLPLVRRLRHRCKVGRSRANARGSFSS